MGLSAAALAAGEVMSGWYLLGGLLALGLLMYLVAALLRPEHFS